MTWKSLTGSALAHVVAFVTLFLLHPMGRSLAVPSSIQVNLVNLPRGASAAPATVAQPEAPEKSNLTPERTPPRPLDKVVKVERGESRKPSPRGPAQAGTSTGPASLGAPGLSGEVGTDADFEFTYYLIALRNKIGQNWSAPAGLVSRGKPVRAVVYFRVQRNGAVADPRLEESSGVGFFDQSAVRAVVISNPLPPLPLGYGGSSLGVHFAFEYTGP